VKVTCQLVKVKFTHRVEASADKQCANCRKCFTVDSTI